MSARDRILAKLKANAPATAGELPDVAAWYAAHRSEESNADKAKRSALEVAGWVGEVFDDARTLARRMFGQDANPAASDDVVPDENGGN